MHYDQFIQYLQMSEYIENLRIAKSQYVFSHDITFNFLNNFYNLHCLHNTVYLNAGSYILPFKHNFDWLYYIDLVSYFNNLVQQYQSQLQSSDISSILAI